MNMMRKMLLALILIITSTNTAYQYFQGMQHSVRRPYRLIADPLLYRRPNRKTYTQLEAQIEDQYSIQASDGNGNSISKSDARNDGYGFDDNVNTRNNVETFLVSFPELYKVRAESLSDDGNMSKTALEQKMSKTTRTMKAWKEYCLGDGGVYFDQRPKALKSLNSLLSMEIAKTYLRDKLLYRDDGDNDDCNGRLYEDRNDLVRVELAVISTCARFEILVTMQHGMMSIHNDHERLLLDTSTTTATTGDLLRHAIVSTISGQISFQRRRKRYMLQTFLPFTILDLPSRIHTTTDIDMNIKVPDQHQKQSKKHLKSNAWRRGFQQQLSKEVIVTEGVHDVSKRLCMIAAGLQDRPLFRPFSARDSHIMQQIKRTANSTLTYTYTTMNQNSSATNVAERRCIGTWTSKSTHCKLLFDAALQSGKAARSSKVVPILEELRDASKGADGPLELSLEAAKSAEILAITPVVNICVSKFKAMEAANSVSDLRERACILVRQKASLDLNSDDCREVRKILHAPTMKLREGRDINVSQVLQQIELELSKLNI